MPNLMDNATIVVLSKIPTSVRTIGVAGGIRLPAGSDDQTASAGDVIEFPFLYKSGFPSATAFSDRWYFDSGQTQPVPLNRLPPSRVFVPATPLITGLTHADESADAWTRAILRVTVPTVPAGNRGEVVDYYAIITSHQVNFN